MKILVIGGAGYIGSVLVGHLLAKKHEVRVLDKLLFGGESLLGYWYNPKFQLIVGDVRKIEDVKPAIQGVDAIVNLAALVGEDACNANPKAAKEINCDAAIHIADVALRLGISRYIFISTCSNYGISQVRRKAIEEDVLRPLSLYSQTKVNAETAILKFSHKSFLPSILRLGTVFGLSSRMRFDLIVNEFVWQAYQQNPLSIYKPSAWRPLVHIVDVAQSIAAVLAVPSDRIRGQVFNIGYKNYQKLHLAQLVQHAFPHCQIDEVKGGDKRDYLVSFEKARRVLKFRATRGVEEGINEMAQALKLGIFTDRANRDYTNRHTFPL